MKQTVLLSVDWDAFFRLPPHWVEATEPLWHIEARWRHAVGRDLAAELTPPATQGPHAQTFWEELSAVGLDLSGAALWFGEEHSTAHDRFLALPTRPSNRLILHVDSHHDMGYGDTLDAEKEVTSGNWLLHVLLRRKGWNATLVYPEWVGYEELDSNKWHWRSSMKKRVVPEVWGSPALKLPKGTKVEGVFVARSPGWTPPWADDAFTNFMNVAAAVTGSPVLLPNPRPFRWSIVHSNARVTI